MFDETPISKALEDRSSKGLALQRLRPVVGDRPVQKSVDRVRVHVFVGPHAKDHQ